MNVEGWLLLAVLSGILVLSRLLARFGSVDLPWYRDATLMFTLPWVLGALVYVMPLFIYREPLALRHVLFLAGCHVVFLIGAMVARFASAGRAQTGAAVSRTPLVDVPRLLWWLAIAGTIGQVLICAGGLMGSSISLIDRLTGEGLAQVRLDSIGIGVTTSGGPFTRLNFLGAAAFVFVLMYAGGCVARAPLSSSARWKLGALAVLSVLLIAFNGLFIRGGRMELVLLALGLGSAALLDRDRHVLNALRRRVGRGRVAWTIVTVSLAVVLVGYLATGFTKKRIGTASAYAAMAAFHRTAPSPQLEALTAQKPALEFAALNLSYLSVPMVTFGYYFDQRGAGLPGPFWGQYNFTGPATFVVRRFGMVREQRTLQDIRTEATTDLYLRGFGENVWSTAMRDMAFDVGWWGVPPLMFIFGLLAQRLLIVAGRTRSGVFMALAPLAVLWLVLSVAHSLFVLESFATAIYMCLVVLLIQALARKFRGKAAARPPKPARARGRRAFGV